MLAIALAPSAALAAPEWRLEQPAPPAADGEASQTPVGLGHIGDIEFLQPNLGLLITAGNGKAVPPGVWAYNGTGWHELSNVCGASEGRIAWAGPEEFWTVSDGRPGQAANKLGQLPPLEDDTLCHFLGGSIVESYASLAFSASSYQPMDAAACDGPADCWFGGAPLPAPQPGAFQLHWNGSSLAPEPNMSTYAIGDMRVFQGRFQEAAALSPTPPTGEETIEEILHPTVLYEISPEGTLPLFKALRPLSARGEVLPEYASESVGAALEYLHLGVDEDSLWAAGQARGEPPRRTERTGVLTVLRESDGVWSQVLGPEGPGAESLHVIPRESPLAEDQVNAIAAEPGTSSAWLAVQGGTAGESSPTALAHVMHVTATGSISEEELPSEQQREAGLEPKGAAARITCPAQNDCWLVTTQGWLFHLSEAGAETLPLNPDSAINGPLISFRPHDEGLPQVPSDAPPADTSGIEELPPVFETIKAKPETFARVSVPLLSDVHSRLLHGTTTLELSFKLAVKAQVRLVAKRRRSVVASTRTETLKRGSRHLLLRLNRSRWPTKLDLQTRALAPLPTVSSQSSTVESIGTSFVDPGPLERQLLGSWG